MGGGCAFFDYDNNDVAIVVKVAECASAKCLIRLSRMALGAGRATSCTSFVGLAGFRTLQRNGRGHGFAKASKLARRT